MVEAVKVKCLQMWSEGWSPHNKIYLLGIMERIIGYEPVDRGSTPLGDAKRQLQQFTLKKVY